MINRKPNLYLLPVVLLCLHLVFTISSFGFYTGFQKDLETRVAEYDVIKTRLRQIDETQLNKDYVLQVMANNVQDSETFVFMFKTLAELAFLASCFSVLSLIQIYKNGKQRKLTD